MRLHQYVETAARTNSDKVFLKSSSGNYSYGEVHRMAELFSGIFLKEGIKKNDRVVLYSSKNPASIALMTACSMCDCLYVPVSSLNPANRAKYIIEETDARLIVCDEATGAELLNAEIVSEMVSSNSGLFIYSRKSSPVSQMITETGGFILFTSGSTGTPKGVVISNEAAITFVEWAASEFKISGEDVLASIAPFNFDLSVFDIYVTAKSKATLLLYSEDETKNAMLMAQKISMDSITTIYATPTFYSTLAYYGKLNKYDYSQLKNILFAGEVFQLEHFNKLLEYWPGRNYFNLYGPTETNVCTFFRVDISSLNYPVFPIGKPCSFADVIIVDEKGDEIKENNNKGELLVSGKSLFTTYWNDSEKTAKAFFVNENRQRLYRTGDIVFRNDEGDYVFVSRKDRMIKKNGYRIEPSEVESIISSFRGISNVAVLFAKDKNQLIGFVEITESDAELSNTLKQFCQIHLPLYMIPDKFVFLKSMPLTTSGKIDLLALHNQM